MTVVVLLIGFWAFMNFVAHPKGSGLTVNSILGKYPSCPSSLSGILTSPLMDPKYIGSMIPLGNVSPPGHTSPVDHIYFNVNTDDQIPLLAPADGWITHVMANSVKATATSDYVFDSYVVTYTICDGLVLDFAGYTDLTKTIQDALPSQNDATCTAGITKVGHDSAAEKQCDFKDLNIKVTSGELVGHTHRTANPNGGYTIPFEIWTADYNIPARSDVNWTYYADDRYAHNYCTFDLYSGDLKSQFDAKFGSYESASSKDSSGKTVITGTPVFKARSVQPVCGTVNQDIVGTLQGMWFSQKPNINDKNVEASGQGISFIHYNIDPTIGEIVVGGELSNNIAGTLQFTPTHSGTINREPSEVKADGLIYCYPGNIQTQDAQNNSFNGKILVQVIDDHHIKVENQTGTCSASEALSNPYNFAR